MGLRYRKSVNMGPFRVNFSKTGIGCSVGVPGFRYTITADGRERKTFSIPGTGLSYVEESGKKSRQANSQQQAVANGNFEEIHNGRIEDLSSVEYKQFIEECQAWMSSWNLSKKILIWSLVAMLLLLIMGVFRISIFTGIIIEAFPLAVAGYAIHLMNTLKNNKVEVAYSFEVTPNPYTDLQQLFEGTKRSERLWSTKSITHNIKSREHAGATQTVDLKNSTLRVKQPIFLNTNINCYCLDLPYEDLYILPDKVIFVRKAQVGAVNISSINMSCNYSDFRWYDAVPSDTVVTGYSWQYVNKNGSPDKRYKDNRQVPICKFGYMEITSPEGINIMLYTSNYDKAKAFYNKWISIRNEANNRRYTDEVKPEVKKDKPITPPVIDAIIADEKEEQKSIIPNAKKDSGIQDDRSQMLSDINALGARKREKEKIIKDDEFVYSGNAYVLNTDYKGNQKHHEFMIDNGVAAAYGEGYTDKIDRITENDLVFLYQSGAGIIALGKASNNKFQNADEQMLAIQLVEFKKFLKPLPASEIKRLINFNFPFVQTLFPVRQEHVEKLLPEIWKDYIE